MRTTLVILFISVTSFLGACQLVGSDDAVTVTAGIVVANQGNFADANGSLTIYNPETATSSTALANIGSIVQSFGRVGNNVFVMANTADRVDVFDFVTNRIVGQLASVTSPRYFVQVSPTLAFISNLFEANFAGGSVTEVDLSTMSAGARISVGNNPEGMAVVGSTLFVANHGFGAGSTVSVINTGTGSVVETVDVDCDGPRMLFTDADEEVIVFCTGQLLFDVNFNPVGETDGAIRVLDGRTGAVKKRIAVTGRIGATGPGQDAFHSARERTVFAVTTDNSILVFDTRTNTLVGTLGPFTGAPIGAIAYDDIDDRLYLGRVPGFTTAGSVTIHERTGARVGSFQAGIAPTYIDFVREER